MNTTQSLTIRSVDTNDCLLDAVKFRYMMLRARAQIIEEFGYDTHAKTQRKFEEKFKCRFILAQDSEQYVSMFRLKTLEFENPNDRILFILRFS